VPQALYLPPSVTFILTNGERKSGEVVFHGGNGNNFIDGQLNLGDNGKEQSFPIEQVAVIDFTGGAPASVGVVPGAAWPGPCPADRAACGRWYRWTAPTMRSPLARIRRLPT